MWRTCADRLRRRIAPGAWSRTLRAPVRACVGCLFSLRGALVLVGLAAILAVGTAIHFIRRGRLEERVIVEYERANALYEQGDLAGARDGFRRALRTLRALGAREHFLAAEIRRKRDESRVIADLLPITLEELARRTHAAASPADWRETFDREHRGRTVIFDTTLTALPGGDGAPGMAVGYEVRSGHGRRLALDFTGCDLFTGPSWKVGTRVIFAATLERMTSHDSAGEATGPWTFHFAPDRYVLILDERLLRAGGLEVDDDVAATIARQRDIARQ